MGRQTARVSNQFVATEKGSRSNINIAKDKPSQASLSTQGIFGVSGSKPLGSIGGVNITQTASLDLGGIIGPQGLIVGVNPVEKSLTLGVAGGISNFLGGATSVTIKPGGFLGAEITGVSFGVNILGFGASAENDGSKSSSFSISAFGGKISLGSHEDGTTSLSIGISLPGFETGITLQPDGKKPENGNSAPGTPPDITLGPRFVPRFSIPISNRSCKIIFTVSSIENSHYYFSWAPRTLQYTLQIDRRNSVDSWKRVDTYNNYDPNYSLPRNVVTTTSGSGTVPKPYVATKLLRSYIMPGTNLRCELGLVQGIPEQFGLFALEGNESAIESYLNVIYAPRLTNTYSEESTVDYFINIIESSCLESPLIPEPSPTPENTLFIDQGLPNYPQNYKRMDCCEQVKEIYKYLGIAKMKKKFKVAKQFLVPGGQGNEECEDYYALSEALFRMLANGLIINPISKPLGSEWKSVNATAWAGQMYEMTAEAMSNGDSTQKYEIAAIMQQVQLMSAVAELSRKVDFLQEAIGHLPDLGTEEVPVCFTIHESHKGFGKKEKQVIDITAPKTDADVEKVLGKMLQPSKIPIVRWEFKPGAISIASALNKL